MKPTTPEQARELASNLEASTLMGSSRAADYLRSLVDQLDTALQDRVALAMQVEALTAERNEARQKFNEADLMAECTTMLRNDLIEAGIVSETVPPMMLTEAIMVQIKSITAERDQAIEAGHTAVEMCGKLTLERDSLRVSLTYAMQEKKYTDHIDAIPKSRFRTLMYNTLKERDSLRTELDRLKQQEPVYLMQPDGRCFAYGGKKPLGPGHADATLMKLYLAAGAQTAEIEALRADAERSEPCQECGSRNCNGECSGDGAMGD